MAMDYVKEKYKAALANKLSFEEDENVLRGKILEVLGKEISECVNTQIPKEKTNSCSIEFDKLFKEFGKFSGQLEKFKEKLNTYLEIEKLKTILGSEIQSIEIYT